MRAHSLTHLSDAALLRDLAALVARDRATTADLLAHIAEVDARRLYLPAGYPSMFAYCVEELHLSEDAAAKRIRAARAARQFPALFLALADGRLHLTAVRLLAPHLTPGNLEELLAAATHRRKGEIEQLLALRFPQAFPEPQARAVLRALPAIASEPLGQPAPENSGIARPGILDEQVPGPVTTTLETATPGPDGEHAPGHVAPPAPEPPPPTERFLLRLTIGRSTHDTLRYAQALLSHSIPSGEVAQVLDRALDALIDRLEKRKFVAASRPQAQERKLRPRSEAEGQPQDSTPPLHPSRRHVPAPVRRAVWERDGGQCTFVGDAGHRCTVRSFLELDHVDPVAGGGRATVENLRLRCRAHNQHEAERAFGTEFMRAKRERVQRTAETATVSVTRRPASRRTPSIELRASP